MENLVELATIYPNVKILHFYVDVQNKHLDFKVKIKTVNLMIVKIKQLLARLLIPLSFPQFQLKDGPRHVPHYGLLLAEVAGLPSSVITASMNITARITQKVIHI